MVDIAEEEQDVVSDEDVDEGPGFWWISPEHSNKIESHEENTILEKQNNMTDMKALFALVDFPGVTLFL